jgi:hypothetical protein
VPDQTEKIAGRIYTIVLSDDHFEVDLVREIARIANLSRQLDYKLRAEKRNMMSDETYVQLGHSASLLKAVLKHYKKTVSRPPYLTPCTNMAVGIQCRTKCFIAPEGAFHGPTR